ncbi:hypothetical protein L3Q82_021813 [Scortum barcoo]|uniref:Uncharacterized protein n=1 Tax=Scortum barcoo TaxID=214431 RepID=A0ACB8X724_9TELE|nr:hypothetical protein L3Q82_021813 [Scortum barcoo]
MKGRGGGIKETGSQKPYTIKLKPDAKPFSLKVPRRVPLPLMGKVKKELEMENMGVISCVEQPTDWCCGMVVAPKIDKEEVHICVDMTPLNESVCHEKFISPSVDQTLGMLTGAQYFTYLDANMGFWQIPLSKESALYTTFITPFGRHHYNRLPFGISSAPEHFQNRMVTEVTAGLEGVVCHMDDILIWGATKEQHNTRMHAILERAQKAGVTLNVSKCEFRKREIKFLGYIISRQNQSSAGHEGANKCSITQPDCDLMEDTNIYICAGKSPIKQRIPDRASRAGGSQLSPTRSTDVIIHLKSMFARHSIPETLISDNGPQFSGHNIKEFAADYGSEHLTSSPKFPQSNGEAEHTVQTTKNLLKKARDPYRALLELQSHTPE